MARGSFLQAPNGPVTCLLLPFYAQPSPKYQNWVSLSIPLSPQSGLSHLDSFCTSVVPHITLTCSSILNAWTRRASAFHSTTLSSNPPVRFGTVCVQFEVSICATRECVFVMIKPEIGTETLDQLQGCWPLQLFLHHGSERTQGLK